MNGYDLSRAWFDFAFETKECKTQHTALYMWMIELNNRLGWKNEFGLPTHDTMEGLSIGNKQTYLNALRDLKKWGFIKIIQESKNQFQACIVSICRVKNAPTKHTALDNMLLQNRSGIDTSIGISTGVSIVPIDKQINHETNKPLNNSERVPFLSFYDQYGKKRDFAKCEKKWNSLSARDQQKAIAALPGYKKSTPDVQYRKNPLTWLNGKCWLDEIEAAAPTADNPYEVKPLANNEW
jgi:hypothetical protein